MSGWTLYPWQWDRRAGGVEIRAEAVAVRRSVHRTLRKVGLLVARNVGLLPREHRLDRSERIGATLPCTDQGLPGRE